MENLLKEMIMNKNSIQIKYKVLDDTCVVPQYQTAGSAGADICSRQSLNLEPSDRQLVSTGLFLEIPEGYECQIRPRSGLAYKHGVTVLNSPATIDSDYRGEIKVLLVNLSNNTFTINKGDRIAQLVFSSVTKSDFVLTDELSDTNRGQGGFGSTGT